MRIQTGLLLLASVLVPSFVTTISAWGYIRLNTGDPGVLADLTRADAAGVQFYLNSSVAPGATSSLSGKSVKVITTDSDPTSAMKAALASWRGVTTANINLLPLLSTTAGLDANDFKNVVGIAQDPASLSVVGSALAVTSNVFTLGTGRIGPYGESR